MAIFTTYLLAVFGALLGINLRVCIWGRQALFISCAIVLGFGGVLGGWLGGSTGVPTQHVIAALVLTAGLIFWHSRSYERGLKMRAILAPRLSSFAKENFSSLDLDADGLLTLVDLQQAVLQPAVSRNDRVLILNLLHDLTFIGHSVDADLIPPPAGSSYPYVTVVNHYGIDAEDLETYPQRAAERFEQNACLIQ